MAHSHEELLSFDVATLGTKLREREISPVELTEAYLDRIARTDEKLRTYITITDTVARKEARKAETEIMKGKWRGPFHGVPVALKDLCYTKGIRTTGGSKILANFKPAHDSTVWTRLARAGAVLLGKLNLHEFAYEDAPLPMAAEQTISQPYIVALMTDALALEGGEEARICGGLLDLRNGRQGRDGARCY